MRFWIGRNRRRLRPATRIALLCLTGLGFASAAYNGFRAYQHAGDGIAFVVDRAKSEAELVALSLSTINQGFYNRRVSELLNDCNEIWVAESYLAVGNAQGLVLDPEVAERLEERTGGLDKFSCAMSEGFAGAVTGDGSSAAAIAGSIAADFTPYGDLRDLTREGIDYSNGEDVDAFILSISAVGLALTAGTYLSAGTAAPAKLGVSLIKKAAKAGKLTPGFRRALKSSIDDAAGKGVGQASSVAIRKIASDAGAITKATNGATTLRLLKHVDTPKDLERMRVVAEIGGKRTAAWDDALGSRILKAAKSSIKVTTKFLIEIAMVLISLVIAVVSAIVTFGLKWAAKRTLKAYG